MDANPHTQVKTCSAVGWFLTSSYMINEDRDDIISMSSYKQGDTSLKLTAEMQVIYCY
jgi:hypothetical protein